MDDILRQFRVILPPDVTEKHVTNYNQATLLFSFS